MTTNHWLVSQLCPRIKRKKFYLNILKDYGFVLIENNRLAFCAKIEYLF